MFRLAEHTSRISGQQSIWVDGCLEQITGDDGDILLQLRTEDDRGDPYQLVFAVPGNIRPAALIRNRIVLPWTEVGSRTVSMELSDPDVTPGFHWYVPTVEVETAYGNEAVGYCHASPFFCWVNKT
mgnify:CR=1 FL=1